MDHDFNRGSSANDYGSNIGFNSIWFIHTGKVFHSKHLGWLGRNLLTDLHIY
jgi:hypothetical protein